MASSKNEGGGRALGYGSADLNFHHAADFQPDIDRYASLCKLNPQLEPGSLLFAEMAACDLMGAGLLACDLDCRIVGANRVALAILRTGDGLKVGVDGVLQATRNHDLSTDALLRKMVARALDGQPAAAFVVPRSANASGLTVIVKQSVSRSGAQPQERPLALVLMIDPAQPTTNRWVDLQNFYGLSAGEVQLASLLMDGLSLVQCCDELAISRPQGRARLQALFRKTGARRRGGLLALLAREHRAAQSGSRSNKSAERLTVVDRPH